MYWKFNEYLSVDDWQFSATRQLKMFIKSLVACVIFRVHACVAVISLCCMNLMRMLAMHRVDMRLVTCISSRAAKRLNDKRATGINLSSFPGWWSGNFLLIVGGNRVCRPVDQTLNSSLLRCALLPIRLPNGYTASTNRCCTVCTSTTTRALLARESGAYCMDRTLKRSLRG